MRKELYFKIKNRIDDLEYMNFSIQGFLEAHDIPDMTIFNVNLVLEELITNIIKYGYYDEPEGQFIRIHIDVSSDQDIYMKLEDKGSAFNPLEAPEPDMDIDVEDMQVGGLGLHLVRNIIKDIRYTRKNDENIQEIWLAKDQSL